MPVSTTHRIFDRDDAKDPLVKSPRRDAKMVKRVKKQHAELKDAFENVEFLVRDIYLSIKSRRSVPSDQWALLEQEFDSIQKATKVLLPACREAVADLGR